jgi:hypothetical protein
MCRKKQADCARQSSVRRKERKKKTAARSRKIETAKGLPVRVAILKLQKLQSACKFCATYCRETSQFLCLFGLFCCGEIKTSKESTKERQAEAKFSKSSFFLKPLAQRI